MAIKLMVNGDLVLGKHNGNFGVPCPDELEHIDIRCLRVLDGNVIDASDNKQWFIDQSSFKHIVNTGDYQPLECDINDTVLMMDGVWIVANALYWDKQTARKLRDELRSYVDTYASLTATIDDVPVTTEQMNEAIAKSHELAAWPSLPDWPYIELPKLPDWMPIPVSGVPVWPVN